MYIILFILGAGLISDNINIVIQGDEISMHRITKDSMAKYTQQYMDETRYFFSHPVDADRYNGVSSDTFYLFFLDQNWERILWLKCSEATKGFYTGGPAKRYGGITHAPGVLRNPSSIALKASVIFVADTDNDRIVKLEFHVFEDTIVYLRSYTSFGGVPLSHPTDVVVNGHFVLKDPKPPDYFFILDTDNGRIISYNYFKDQLRYIYDGSADSISLDGAVGIEIHQIPGTNPDMPSYFVYLVKKDRIYLFKEGFYDKGFRLKLINYLDFRDARFSGITRGKYSDKPVILVVDKARKKILCIGQKLSRSYFVYTSTTKLSDGVFNITGEGDEIITFAPYLSSTGMDFFKLNLTGVSNDRPRLLTAKGYETHIRLSWYADPRWSFEKFLVEKREEGKELWRPVGWTSFSFNQSFYSDCQVEPGKKYFYRVRAYKTDYYTATTDSISVIVPYLSRPTNLQAVFEDSIVKLTWVDNSSLNKEYYIGKEVTGRYNNQDTTVTFHLVHLPGDRESFIDTMPIEGTNIYRVAAIDSTNYYWYSDYDTISIPIPRASDLRVISLPDTTAYISFNYNSSIVTKGSIRRKNINGNNYSVVKWFGGEEIPEYNDQGIKVDSTYVYKCHSEQKFNNIYYFWGWGENPDSVIYQWDNIPPTVNISGGDLGIGDMEYNLEWSASDNEGINEQDLEFDGDVIHLDGDIREYTLSKGNYNGWYNTLLTVEDFAGLTSSDNQNVALCDPANKDISIYLWLENPGSISKVYLHYTVPVADETYTVYQRLNDGNWWGNDYYFRNTTGDEFLNKIDRGDSYSAFMSKEEGDVFIHYSDVASVTNPGGGGGQCPLLYVYTDSGFVFDNSLLPRSEYIQKTYEDRYILRELPDTTRDYRFMILDNIDNAFIDRIRFYALDHPLNVEIGVTNKGTVLPYLVNTLPVTAFDNEGKDWVDSVKSIGKGCYKGMKRKNDTLWVEFGKGDGDYILTRDDPPLNPKERFGLSGDTLYTRVKEGNILTHNDGKNKVSYTLLDSVGGIDYISLVRSLPDRFIRKGKATIKNLPQELRKKDGVYYKIAPGDTNEFSFFKVKQKIPTGWVRDYVIEVVGYYTGNGKGAESPEGVVTYKNDIRFIRSLGKEIVMEFESARDRNVGITLYDVTGRVIRKEVLKLSTGIQRYSIRDLPSGIYFIRVPDMKDKVHKVTVIR